MKDVYDFLSDAREVIEAYFSFFYNKSINDINFSKEEKEEAEIKDQEFASNEILRSAKDELYEKKRGKWIDLKGREKEFEELIHSFLEKYKVSLSSHKSVNKYIYSVEKTLINTDETGREAVMRRIVKALGETARIGVYGFDEIDMICPFDGNIPAIYRIYENRVITTSDNPKLPDELSKVDDSLSFIQTMSNRYYRFMTEFRELCKDFDLDFEDTAKAYEYYELIDLPKINFTKERKKTFKEEYKTNKKNDFTKQRKKIAIMALLDALNVKAGACGDIPLSNAQRFIHFLINTGSKDDDINRATDIPELFKADRSQKVRIKDASFVADYLKKLGLDKLAEKVINDAKE